MQITLNGHTQELPEATTVAQLLERQGLLGQPCAVEINRKLVPRRSHDTHTLSEGDEVELVTLVGGG